MGVLGAPLPAIHLHAPAVMLNVLGQHVEAAERYVTEKDVYKRQVRDQESIEAADKYGLTMIFTGVRHFRH